MPYAEASDIETRLRPRLGREFTDDEEAAADLLCEAASAVIDDAVGQTPKDVPPVLRFIAIEVVCRAMANPQGLISEQEGLGAYSYAQRFASGEGAGLWLTELEERMARRAVYGSLTGSVEVESIASDICTICRLAPSLCNGLWLCGCEVEGS